MENQQNISNEAIASTEINNNSNETVINSNETTNNFDITKYFSEDLKKDADFERLSKNIPNDLNALVKDLYHKTKHFGKARDVVKAELEAELNKTYEENDYQYKMPENYSLEDELLTNAKTKAIELGIKPEQFKSFMETMFEADFKIKLQYFTSTEDDEKIQNLPADAKILLAKIMDKVSQKIQEPSIGKLSALSSQDDAQSKIDKILSNPNHLYHKGDLEAVNEVMNLYKIIANGQLK